MRFTRDLMQAVAKSTRPRDRNDWLALGGWRTRKPLVGEALLDAIRENA